VLTLLQTSHFVAEFRRLRLNDDDLRSLERALMENPEAGKVMARTGGVRKMRFAPASRGMGKRGALRVCYIWIPDCRAIGLFMIYPKKEQDTLTAEDEKVCRLLSERIRTALRKEQTNG
jgi:hypothetical protein